MGTCGYWRGLHQSHGNAVSSTRRVLSGTATGAAASSFLCQRKDKTSLRPRALSNPIHRRGNGPRASFFRASIPSTCENHTATVLAPHTPVSSEPLPPYTPSKEQLLSLVDQHDAGTVEEHLDFYRDPYRRGYAPADGPTLTVSSKREDAEYPSPAELQPADGEELKILRELRHAITNQLRRPGSVQLDHIYHIYQQLPEPRMCHLPGVLRHRLLRVLGEPEKRNPKSMLRYFAVIADVKNSGLPLKRSEWNNAIAYAARYVGTSTDAETESALNLWREMERDAGRKANDVTFSILFDVASKSGAFALAEMIYQEMESRGFTYNRYHHVSLIHYFGLKYDTDGIRAAYKEMVEAGEVIDTVVLNCVISGLLRSGEEDAADRVYQRMKEGVTKGIALPQRTYATNKMITQTLMMFAKVGRQHPPLKSHFQKSAPISPDLQTYRLLINHYGVKLGNLAKVAECLDDMKYLQIQLHGAIFLALFKGFHAHGGYAGSAWSEQRLNGIWNALIQALDEGISGLTIEKWLAIWVMKAFKKCSSDQAVLEVYEAMESRWDLDQADASFVLDGLHRILTGDTTVNK